MGRGAWGGGACEGAASGEADGSKGTKGEGKSSMGEFHNVSVSRELSKKRGGPKRELVKRTHGLGRRGLHKPKGWQWKRR